MKAMVMTQFGEPEVFEEREVPVPQPQAHEILVKVYATSVNPMDCVIRRGPWPGLTPPAILGYDVSGEVATVGEGVQDFQPGDQVYYTPPPFSQGSNAEYQVVNEAIVALKPPALSHLEAASIPLVGNMAWDVLSRAQLQAGETILIHGGAGGVGSTSIQLAKARGATVFATCRGSHRAFVEALGADVAIDYMQEDIQAVVNQGTQGKGVDVVLDTVGKETLSRSTPFTKPFGRLVTIVGQAGDVTWGVYKNLTIHLVLIQRARSKLDELRALVEQGQFKPVIDTVLPLRKVAQAHQRLEAGGIKGKIVLEVQRD